MATEDAVQHLVTLGLTRAEALVFLALVDAPGARAAEVGAAAGVSRSRVYATIRSLAEKGLVAERPGVYKRFQAVDVATAVHALKQRAARHLDDAAARVLERARASSRSVPVTGPTVDAHAVTCLRFLATARRDVRAIVRHGDFLGAPGIADAAAGIARDARVRVITEPTVTHPFRAHPDVQVRRVARVNASLLVVDDEVAVLAEPGNGTAGHVTVAENARLARFLAELFESVWSHAEALN